MKQCKICNTTFVKNPNKDWHKGPMCKRCYGRNKAKEIYNLDPEKILLKNKRWRNNNKEKVHSLNKEWFLKNSHKIKIYNDNAKQYKAVYYQAHKEKYKEKHAQYYQLNKKAITTKSSQLREENPLIKLRHNISTHINKSLRKFKTRKSNKTTKIIGLSIVDFRLYLEYRFEPGMTWDNYGKWHIDHICPLSQAQNEYELYKLWNYNNLSPLWAKDNIAKSNNKTQEAEEKCLKILNRRWIWKL